MTGSRIVAILNSIEDAEDFLARMPRPGPAPIVATHAGVVAHLEQAGIAFLYPSDLFQPDTLIPLLDEADGTLEAIVADLDDRLTGPIATLLKTERCRYFRSLYRYSPATEYAGLLKLRAALLHIREREPVDGIVLYDSLAFTNVLDATVVEAICRDALGDIPVERRAAPPRPPGAGPSRLTAVAALERGFQAIVAGWHAIRERLARPRSGKPRLVLCKPLYDLDFLPQASEAFDMVVWDIERRDRPPGRCLPPPRHVVAAVRTLLEEARLSPPAGMNGSALAIRSALIARFRKELASYLAVVRYVDSFCTRTPVAAHVWGNAPAVPGPRGLINECFMTRGIPVVGMQHGGSYCDHNLRFLHRQSDFVRCTHFLTYGFSADDLHEAYPGERFDCAFIPTGSVAFGQAPEIPYGPDGRPDIDILYPLTIQFSMFWECQRNGALLLRNQRAILDMLDRPGSRVVIKPVPHYDRHTCVVSSAFGALRHARVESEPLSKVLSCQSVGAVVIDAPSTPLLQVVPLDAELFILEDPVFPFTPQARRLLDARAYVVQSVDELARLLAEYRAGTLPRRRDNGYQQLFVPQKDARPAVLAAIAAAMRPVGKRSAGSRSPTSPNGSPR